MDRKRGIGMGQERPELNEVPDEAAFRSFYYLKEELAAFCRANGLPASGGKSELTERVACFLAGRPQPPAGRTKRGRAAVGEITPETLIEPDFVCSEAHRAFFKAQIGTRFSFLVPFQNWLKANTGKTYAQAVEAYGQILEQKKTGRTEIGRQFEYNTYIRDFFQANPGAPLRQAILCWKYKKALPGHNRYESADLAALEEESRCCGE